MLPFGGRGKRRLAAAPVAWQSKKVAVRFDVTFLSFSLRLPDMCRRCGIL